MEFQLIAALVFIQVLFGINYVISKIIVNHFNPIFWAFVRLFIATLFMFIICKVLRRKHPPLKWEFFGPMIVFSLLGAVINQACFLLGIRYTTATNSAVLNTLIPVFTLFIVAAKGQEPMGIKGIFGFLMSLAGVLVLRKVEEISLSDQTLIGDLYTVVNCISYALFLAYSKKFVETYDRFWTTTWLFGFGTIGLFFISLPEFRRFQWPNMDLGLWGSIVFNILGGTVITYFLNIWTLSRVKSSSVALFIYLQPVVASGLAWWYFGENLTLRTALSTLLIFSGLVLALKQQTKES